MRAALKQFLFRILGKDPEAIVVSFATGDAELAAQMFAEIQRLEPERKHVLVRPDEFPAASTLTIYGALRQRFHSNRIGLAPVLLGDPRYNTLRRAAFLFAPRKILAYNQRLERHHLRVQTWIASWLFLRGAPLDRIFLRPKWLLPWKRDRSVYPSRVQEIEGRRASRSAEAHRSSEPVLPVSALAWRRSEDFQPAARDGRGVRRFSLRLHRSGNAGRFQAGAGALRPPDPGEEGALSGTALVER